MSTRITLSNGPVSFDADIDSDDCNTVAQLIELYREQLHLSGNETPTVNGEPVDPDTEVEDGDDVAFTKTAGSKG